MSKNKILQPKIRFKEFSGENAEAWEQRKASELFKSISDKNHPNLPVLSASQEKGMILRDDIGIDIKYDHKSLSNYKRVTPGQFVIHLRSFQGGFADSQMEGITSPAYTVIDFKEKDQSHSLFWKEILTSQSFIKRLETVTYGIRDGRSISFSDFSTLKFIVPKLDEQEKIAVLFKILNQTITLHQRKLEALENLKKTLLSKMFPKNGKAVPELRFAGFTDNWEQRKASELFKSISDKNHPNLPVLSASQEKGMILRDDIGIDIKYDHKSLSNYKRVTPGQFVIHLRSFQGGFADSQMEGITSPAYTVIDFKEKDQSHSLFWKEILTSQSFIKRLETVTYGIRDGRSISFSDFSTLKFIVPKLDEQEKIAVLFKILNQTITLHQRKIEQYQELKKTLLSKMFI
ncbi:restriction endonuclease subunit S [Globicatella sanguinis]